MKKWHTELHEAGVKLSILMFSRTDRTGSPVREVTLETWGGVSLAIIKRLNAVERSLDKTDLRMVIDAYGWSQLTHPEREALLDHELEHLTVRLLRNGAVRLHGDGHPMLKDRWHDIEIGMFMSVITRHAETAVKLAGVKQAERDIARALAVHRMRRRKNLL